MTMWDIEEALSARQHELSHKGIKGFLEKLRNLFSKEATSKKALPESTVATETKVPNTLEKYRVDPNSSPVTPKTQPIKEQTISERGDHGK